MRIEFTGNPIAKIAFVIQLITIVWTVYVALFTDGDAILPLLVVVICTPFVNGVKFSIKKK